MITSADIPQSRMVNRLYSNFDMYPTILASIGVDIKGDMLGIGTDLFSGRKTLFEKYGIEEANKELEKKSDLYNTQILTVSEKSDK